jgi:hypothetical protein
MILHAQPASTMGTSDAEQRQLWEDVKTLTAPPRSFMAAPTPPSDSSDCGPFAQKLCDCPSNPFCWCTFPTALKNTLLKHAPGANVRIITSVSEQSIQAKIIKSLKLGIAPAVLVHNRKHWVVVGGFDSEADTEVKVFDPEFQSRRRISLDSWETNYLVAPTCGHYHTKHVMIGRDS